MSCQPGKSRGGIRGGISIAVPLDPYLALEQARTEHIVGTHAGLWSLGVLGLFLGTRQMRQRWDQQLQTEEKLRQSEEKFRTVADWTCDMETWRGPDGRFLYVSPSAAVITGYRAEEFLADPKLTLKITHPDDVALVSEHHRKFSQPGNVVCSMDFRILTRNGEERWLTIIASRFMGPTDAGSASAAATATSPSASGSRHGCDRSPTGWHWPRERAGWASGTTMWSPTNWPGIPRCFTSTASRGDNSAALTRLGVQEFTRKTGSAAMKKSSLRCGAKRISAPSSACFGRTEASMKSAPWPPWNVTPAVKPCG